MSEYKNLGIFDFNKIFSEVIIGSSKRDLEVFNLSLMLKNMGYSKKRIKSEIKKYRKQKKRLEAIFNTYLD